MSRVLCFVTILLALLGSSIAWWGNIDQGECESWEWRCQNGTGGCIGKWNACNGIGAEHQIDCPDHSDETKIACLMTCSGNPNMFLCRNLKKCIPKSRVCDGVLDCSDMTDEKYCEVLGCSWNYLCIADQRCIWKGLVCTEQDTCIDGQDEKNCEKEKCFGNFRCPDGSCSPSWCVCNGEDDCGDGGSDEANGTQACEALCPERSQMCADGSMCIRSIWKCDHECDCDDGSDEKSCYDW